MRGEATFSSPAVSEQRPTAAQDTLMRMAENQCDRQTSGAMVISGHIPPQAKSRLQSRLDKLNSMLAPMVDPKQQAAAGVWVAALLGSFGSSSHQADDPHDVAQRYVSLLREWPLWAVKEACMAFERGRVSDQDGRFAPSTAALYQRIRKELEPMLHERHRLTAILGATPVGATECRPEERERVLRGFESLLGAMREPGSAK